MSIEALQAVLNKHHFADEFEPGLELILDGLDRLRAGR